MSIPEKTKREYLLAALRAVDLSEAAHLRDLEKYEPPTEKEEFELWDTKSEAIGKELAAVEARFQSDPSDRLRLLLAYLQRAAALAGGELGRVLLALESATFHGDSIVNDRKRRGTLLGIANGYLEEKPEDVLVGASRSEFVRRIAERFQPEPADVGACARDLVLWMEGVGLERVIGPSKGEWWLDVVRQCEIVRNRSEASRRLPIDYARGVLRGWGLTEEQAGQAAKPIGY
jgi:hypothetical protein